MSNKAYKFRIYPNAEQSVLFDKTFGCVRFIYNVMLGDKIKHYQEQGKMLNNTPAQYKSTYVWLKEVDSLALANAQLNLQAAYKNFFGNPKCGFPKFKSKKKSRCSYTTNNQGNNIRIVDDCIKLPKVGFVKINQHRAIPEEYRLKSVTVSKDPDGKYYVSILFEYENNIQPVQVSEDNILGLDFKASCLYADSNGNFADMPKYYKDSSKRLARRQKKLSRKNIGSKNYQKEKNKVAKLHKHVSNQRKDFLHKKSTEIANQYDLVCIEDLSIKEILQERTYRNYRKSVLDNGWYDFTQMLMYKLNDRGKQLIKVDKSFPSSQICHVCGHLNTELKDDKIRRWNCPQCGEHNDRDINAAINIRNEGYKIYQAA